jgi:2-hydroxychromene-2-carboxylate isomerase
MFVLDGELFWGGDRVDMLIERLNKRRAEQEPMA